MKWIRFLVPLVLMAVASAAYGQWYPTSGRYAPTASAGPSWPALARPFRLIVAEEAAPVATGQETIASSDPGMPGDDCGCNGSWGYSGGKHCGHCKLKKHCCAARASCGGPVGCAAPMATCDDGAACCGVRHKWLHCCKHHLGHGKCCGVSWPSFAWGWGGGGCCNSVMDYSDGAPVPQPDPAGEPIEAPRRVPANGTAEPATKSAVRGWQWPTWTAPAWSSPQPTRARPSGYEYRIR